MYSSMISTNFQPIKKSVLTSQWFDYAPEMDAILNALHKRIFNLELALQTSSQILNRSQTNIDDDSLSRKTNMIITQHKLAQEEVRNSIDTFSRRSARSAPIVDQHQLNSTLEKQFHKLNLSPQISLNPTTADDKDFPNRSSHTVQSEFIPLSSSQAPRRPSSNPMKIRAYELTIIFEHAFDQLNIIHNGLSTTSLHRNNNNHLQSDDIDPNSSELLPSLPHKSDRSPYGLNLSEIIPMNEHDKFLSELKYFFHILMLLFRAVLLESPTDHFLTSINHVHDHLPSIQLTELTNRLQISADKIKHLSFIRKHFRAEKSQHIDVIQFTKSQLTDRLMEEKSRSKIALRYSHDWKENHILQWIQMLLITEKKYTKTIHQYESILQQTEIAHQETIKMLIKQNNEMKVSVNKWYEYYQNETYRFERELIDFRYEFNQMKRRREEMYEEYQRMKDIVDEDHQMKIKERLRLEQQKQQEEAIKRIQAWWRGTMMRHIKQKRRRQRKKRK